MTQFYYKGDPKDYQLRPEEGSAVVATSVTSCSGHMSHLNVKGVSHSALVLISPIMNKHDLSGMHALFIIPCNVRVRVRRALPIFLVTDS